MSFILDALRKSDAERQRAVTPGLSDVRYAARQSRRNIWLPILVVVLAANAVFLAVQWLGRDAAPVAPPPAAPDVAGASQPAAIPAEPAPPASDIRPLAREAEFGEPVIDQGPGQDVESEFAATPGPVPAPVILEAAEIPAAADPSADLPPAPPPEARPATPAPPAAPSRILAGNDLPTAEQLMGSGALNVPVLNLDLHVYSETPAGRFVVINSRKYKEGGQLSEGPTVESITRDGVILSNQGRRFTLSRK